MANFLAVVDPDPRRRRDFIDRVRPLLHSIEGLREGEMASGDFEAVYALCGSAPCSRSDREGRSAVILGEAFDGSRGRPIEAHELHALWRDAGESAPSPLDGFHLALHWCPEAGLRVSCDLLGIFPIYHASVGDVRLVASNPSYFAEHPRFAARLDPLGLAGILLTNGLVEGRSLWRGATRLGPGHVLVGARGRGFFERQQFRLPVSRRHWQLGLAEQTEIAHAAFSDAVGRHARSSDRHAIMLSGGLDSRYVAGTLGEHGISPLALTLGNARDLEMRCARGVARTLGLRHVTLPDAGADDVESQALWAMANEQLSRGFSAPVSRSIVDRIPRDAADRLANGLLMDGVLGPRFIHRDDEEKGRSSSFEGAFAIVNAWGIGPQVLSSLLARERYGDVVPQLVEELRERYETLAEEDYHRHWAFFVLHRQRHHIGLSVWRNSFAMWPSMPLLDRHFLETIFGMPREVMMERRLEIEIVERRFPQLAALPLDRNSFDIRPLVPNLAWRMRRRILHGIRPIRKFRKRRHARMRERLRYFRSYDFDGAQWQRIRRLAESDRQRLHEVFEPKALDALLPGPEVVIDAASPFDENAGRKSLLGLALWLRDLPGG